jgi:hypothetical protein
MKRLMLILAIAMSGTLWLPGAAEADFGIKSLSVTALDEDGFFDLQAGSHPHEWTLAFEMNQDSEGHPEGVLRDLFVELPTGMSGNPLAVPRCSQIDFDGQTPQCPGGTQIGVAVVKQTNLAPLELPVYNLVPPLGSPASAGLTILGITGFLEASIRTGADYGITISDITIPTGLEIQSITTTVWGVPADPSHDPQRFCPDGTGAQIQGCLSEAPRLPFFTLPTSCTGPLVTTLRVDSLQDPGVFEEASAVSEDEDGNPAALTNCQAPPFAPTITAQPETTVADSPTGLEVDLHIPQNEDPDGLATAHLKDTVITLPKGMAVNPSAADGLGACTSAQIDLKGPGPANCPANSKVGTVRIETPALDHPVPGSIHLAKQGDNPFGSLLALYIAVDDPISGVIVKLAGEVEPNPATGQLRTTFLSNPQLPVEDIEVRIEGGPRASLTTPPTCGNYATTAELTPWSAPEGATDTLSDSFSIDSAPGGSCAGSEAQMPHAPSFEAGTLVPVAASYSPFVLRLARENGSQRLGAVSATLPPGLTGKLAGIAQCSDAQLAVAAGRNQPGDGALEKSSPSCPAASEVGALTVGAGSGNPFYVQGKAYLAGPYKGAPLSFAFITPAVAGPFDLGAVLVRAAAYVDPKTTQITVKSDPIPTILEGIPLDVRSVAVDVSRDRFTLNPTSCEPMSLGLDAASSLGQSALLSDPFQVGGCRGLGFEPGLALRLKGGTKRGANPKLIATLTPREGDANIAALSVKLPRSSFLDQAHIRTVCTRVQFAADACPSGSIYGRVSVRTPLLDYPLPGTVYLRSSSNKLPDLVADFRGPDFQPIRIELSGRTDSVKGALRNSFDFVPDAPFSSARLELFGGKRGLVINSTNICRRKYRAKAKFEAHSGAAHEARPVVRNDCGRSGKGKRGSRRNPGR